MLPSLDETLKQACERPNIRSIPIVNELGNVSHGGAAIALNLRFAASGDLDEERAPVVGIARHANQPIVFEFLDAPRHRRRIDFEQRCDLARSNSFAIVAELQYSEAHGIVTHRQAAICRLQHALCYRAQPRYVWFMRFHCAAFKKPGSLKKCRLCLWNSITC